MQHRTLIHRVHRPYSKDKMYYKQTITCAPDEVEAVGVALGVAVGLEVGVGVGVAIGGKVGGRIAVNCPVTLSPI